MADAALNAPHFHDETKAREYLESVRWPKGPVCPHCGSPAFTRLQGVRHRPGLLKCRDCRKQYSVTVGTVFERSKIPLHKWLMAAYLLCSSKKGMSSHQLHRTLGVTYKTAWFMTHRIREAMKEPASDVPMGSGGGIVEADETYFGKKKGADKKLGRKPKAGWGHKMAVFTLVERGGKVRSMQITGSMFDDVTKALKAVSKDATLMTDQAKMYNNLGKQFAGHERVNHSIKEYVRGRTHTNTVEGFFSVFKRGMKGVYQHCSEDHLHRYLVEFDFRYNHRSALGIEDGERMVDALKGIEGRRLTYRRPTHTPV